MRRLVGECSANRFVTGERLVALLKVRVMSDAHPCPSDSHCFTGDA
jgi:hypothetical protein